MFFSVILFREDSDMSMFLGRVVKNTTNMRPSGHGYVSTINHNMTVPLPCVISGSPDC